MPSGGRGPVADKLVGEGLTVQRVVKVGDVVRVGLAVAILTIFCGTAPNAQRAIEVSHHARAVQPGEVVILEVRSARPLVTVRATVFGSSVPFFPDPEGVWRGLVGIDLETRPDEYAVAIRATDSDDTTARATYALSVESKDFPTRRLTVAPSFVDPPPYVLDRIQREAALQDKLFKASTGARQWRGGFLRPVPGDASSSFGRRSVFNGQPRRPHSGTDFKAATGTAIKAPNVGTVVLAEELYFSGNVVIIDHGWGLYSYFAHLSAIDVTQGDVVTRGQVVGKVGATGRVTGPHLHWTVRLNNARVDPIALMTLLPSDESRF